MNQQYDNTNRGVLFKNDRKEKDSQPDYTGSLNVNGVDHFLDAWIKEGQRGKFMSISVKRKDKQGSAPAPAPQQRRAPASAPSGGGGYDESDDIPFIDPLSRRGYHLVM